jgi:hypothetical protein
MVNAFCEIGAQLQVDSDEHDPGCDQTQQTASQANQTLQHVCNTYLKLSIQP